MLELSYDGCAAADVHAFVRREQACCGFLRFDVCESADAVRVTSPDHPRRGVLPTICSLTSSPDRDHRRRGRRLAQALGENVCFNEGPTE
jgi:hypothetical protein